MEQLFVLVSLLCMHGIIASEVAVRLEQPSELRDELCLSITAQMESFGEFQNSREGQRFLYALSTVETGELVSTWRYIAAAFIPVMDELDMVQLAKLDVAVKNFFPQNSMFLLVNKNRLKTPEVARVMRRIDLFLSNARDKTCPLTFFYWERAAVYKASDVELLEYWVGNICALSAFSHGEP